MALFVCRYFNILVHHPVLSTFNFVNNVHNFDYHRFDKYFSVIIYLNFFSTVPNSITIIYLFLFTSLF